MKQFIKHLFSDDNSLNEKSIVGFLSFFMMVITLITDVVSGYLNRPLPIHEFVFDGFLIITLGAFGIASVDKWINNKNGLKSPEE